MTAREHRPGQQLAPGPGHPDPRPAAVRPQGTALTLAALVKGVQTFRTPSQIAGVLLNGCTQRLAELLTPAIQGRTGLPVLGVPAPAARLLHPQPPPGAVHPGRGGGPVRQGGPGGRSAGGDRQPGPNLRAGPLRPGAEAEPLPPLRTRPDGPLVAVARDEAFCFYYEDNLDELRRAGVRLAFFRPPGPSHSGGDLRPLSGGRLPGAPRPGPERKPRHGGGRPPGRFRWYAYPGRVRRVPVPAKHPGGRGGGLLAHGRSAGWGGVQNVPAPAVRICDPHRPGGFPLSEAGGDRGRPRVHRWDCTRNGELCRARRPSGGEGWNCMVEQGNLLAGFPHLYFPSNPQFAVRFAAACRQYQERNAL